MPSSPRRGFEEETMKPDKTRPAKTGKSDPRAPTVTEDAVIYPDSPSQQKASVPDDRKDGETPQMQADCGDLFRSWAHR
jgi:hypothetical protein